MSSRGRAYRRWTLQRSKEHVRYVLKYVWQEPSKWITPERVGMNASVHLKPCSGPLCCGNPRRWPGGSERLTVAERRAALDDSLNLCVPYWNSDERQLDEWWDDFWWEASQA
jgi:hypothetical protein